MDPSEAELHRLTRFPKRRFIFPIHFATNGDDTDSSEALADP